MSANVLGHIDFCKKNIPSSLQICDTFFTQMIMVGSFNCKEGTGFRIEDHHAAALIGADHQKRAIVGKPDHPEGFE